MSKTALMSGPGLSGQRTEALQLSTFQEGVLAIPERYSVALCGGSGSAKSHAMAILALRHAEQYGPKARILYLRKTHQGTADFEQITRDLFGKVYGAAAKFNTNSGVWRLPGGAYMELH
jgi:hypothetical protein